MAEAVEAVLVGRLLRKPEAYEQAEAAVVVAEEGEQLSSSPCRLSQARTKVEAGSDHSAWQKMDELDPRQHDNLIR
jgi:hypothetical protein